MNVETGGAAEIKMDEIELLHPDPNHSHDHKVCFYQNFSIDRYSSNLVEETTKRVK